MRDAEDCAMHRQRASRLAKWMELARDAARANEVKIEPVDALEKLVSLLCFTVLQRSSLSVFSSRMDIVVICCNLK